MELITRQSKSFAIIMLGLSGLSLTPSPVNAQASPASAFPDVKENHWAYQAVQNLADKGLVKGYPNGQFLGNRAMTRFEFATVVDRLLQTVADMKKSPEAAAPAPSVTPDDLNKIQVLVDQFRTELTTIQTDLKTAQDNIDALRQDVMDTKDIAAKATDTANNSYGVGAKRKFTIGGYIQARYQSASTDDQTRFPHGTPTPSGASQYNGNYAQGGNGGSFLLRRSRLKFTGAVTGNTKYAIQLDASGATTVGGQSVTVREGNVTYTLGDGNANNPSITAGLFPNFFGYQLPLSSSSILSPERPLAFNEGGSGLFANQDYDRGLQLSFPVQSVPGVKVMAGLVNGTGLASNAVDRVANQIYRIAYQSADKVLGVGASFYNGELPGAGIGLGSPATLGPPPVAGVPGYTPRKKQLTGFDAQYISPAGPFLLGEYVNGKFEQRSYFGSPTATGLTTSFAPGNKIEGYYVQGGYVVDAAGSHPLTLGVSYDVLRRSSSGIAATVTGGVSGSSFDDKNVGYGVLYNLDKATRVRLWYEKPTAVAHAAGTLAPPMIGLYTGELQVKF